VSTANPDLRYQLADEFVADPTASDPSASVRAAPASSEANAGGGPVYRRVPGGDMVVPTGRVLVRFADGDAAKDHEKDLQAVGCVVDEVLSYAPNTAWVRAATGDVTDGLQALDSLGKVRGVVALEPEMIGSRSTRG
jgi:hypothetical protein